MEAAPLLGLLEASGINALIAGSEMMPNLPSRILVPADQVEQAAALIAEARAAGAEGADEAEQAGEAEGDAAPVE
jgi:hypothetical protein